MRHIIQSLRRRRVWVPAVVALTLSAASSDPAVPQAERYTLSAQEVRIFNLAGSLRIEPTNGNQVVVEVTPGGRDARQLRVETDRQGGQATLSIVYPGRRVVYPGLGRSWRSTVGVADDGRFEEHSFGFLIGRRRVTVSGSGSGIEAHADLRVLVPAGQRLEVRLAAGKSQIVGVDGTLALHQGIGPTETRGTRGTLLLDTGSGAVRVTDAHGDVTLDTGSGSVTASKVDGDRLLLDTGSGDVAVSDVQVRELRADTGSGSVMLQGVRAEDIVLDTGSGSIELELQGDVHSLDADTGSGGITLWIPNKLGAEFEIDTGSGPIEVGVAHEAWHVERDHVRGRIGDGQGRIRIDSGSGAVRLMRRSVSGAKPAFGLGGLLAPAIE